MAWANIYWNIPEIRKFGGRIDDPLLTPIFMGAIKNTHKECLDAIIKDSPAVHYIDTIEVPDFNNLMERARRIFNEDRTAT